MISRRTFLVSALFLSAGGNAAVAAVRVGAAASMKGALDEVGREFLSSRGRPVVATYAASSALARQIEAGAPFDLFISADVGWMDHLVRYGLIDSTTRRNLVGNRLVLVGPRTGGGTAPDLAIRNHFPLASALKGGRLAMANPDVVPAGKYGKAALESLGVWHAVRNNVARAENVRAALTLVARGEAPLGIVYRTDALAEPGVRIIDTFAADLHPPILYPVALVRGSGGAAAREYLAFLAGERAEALWRRHGFTILE